MKLKMILLWAFTASLAFSAETSNWEGTFFWSKRKKQVENITAAFEKDGKDWKATFTFKWGGKDHIYTGTAKGNMKSGNLTGKINSDDKRVRSFTFKGKIKDGKLNSMKVREPPDDSSPTKTMQCVFHIFKLILNILLFCFHISLFYMVVF